MCLVRADDIHLMPLTVTLRHTIVSWNGTNVMIRTESQWEEDVSQSMLVFCLLLINKT